MEFNYNKYKKVLYDFLLNGYQFMNFVDADKAKDEKIIYLRHDVDIDIEKVLDMAKIENELGVSSTWYIMPDNKLYSLMNKDVQKVVKELKDLGHSIGLHIDASIYDSKSEMEKSINEMYYYYSKYIPIDKTISFHIPNEKILGNDVKIDGFVNVYEKKYIEKLCYVSDSNRRPFLEQDRYFDGIKNNKSFQLLIHPVWWNEETMDKDDLKELLEKRNLKKVNDVMEECKWDENPYDKEEKKEILGVSSVVEPKDNTLMFCNEKFYNKYKDNLNKVKNCIILLPKSLEKENIKLENNEIRFVNNPRVAFGKILEEQEKREEKRYISKDAIIDKKSNIGNNALIEPQVIIEEDVKIGKNVTIKSGTKIKSGTTIGNDCYIGNNSALGVDGLAYEYDEEKEYYQKIPQLGKLIIEDNVDIGANSVVAKGAINNTKICKGSKIDNNCFVSHNVELGKNTIMVGNSIVMGSAKIGDNSYISGGVTIRDNIKLGDNVFVGMGSVVTKDVENNEQVIGVPAKQIKKRIK